MPHVIRKAWGLERRSLCTSAEALLFWSAHCHPRLETASSSHLSFLRVAPGLYEECVHLDSSGTCLGTYGLVAAKLLVFCQGYLVFLAPTPSLTLACLPACSQSSSGLCNNPPNQWSFPQAFVPCCILQNGREGPHGRGSHHPFIQESASSLLLSFSWSGWVSVALL